MRRFAGHEQRAAPGASGASVILERVRHERQRRSAAVLRSLSDAQEARRVVAAARWRLLDGSVQIPAPVPAGTSTPVPSAISLEAGEQVLWTGRPQTVLDPRGGHHLTKGNQATAAGQNCSAVVAWGRWQELRPGRS
jgi:hypothetical protein